ncbi:V-type ATP synthase subunit I [Rubritalea spongiae]|uniref:V-type ATP synthase subunit I n=1 Tax=Rubritalea spongiae TaxID=430797 RepID=A0ABW5E7C4_9BACT
MKSLTIVGLKEEKQEVLDGLQTLGCLHLVSLSEKELAEALDVSDETREALQLLQNWHLKNTTPNPASQMSPKEIQERAHQTHSEIVQLQDELELLVERVGKLEPWGDFSFDSLENMGGLSLWFYLVPHHEVQKLEGAERVWQQVGKDSRHSYIVVVSAEEPMGVPGERQHLGGRSLAELRKREEEVRNSISELQLAGAELARELPVFQNHVHELQDISSLKRASKMSFTKGKFFGVLAWVPESEVEKVAAFVRERELVHIFRDPNEDEVPPTLFKNPPAWEVGESLIGFYMTPNYRLWDPSFIVLYSFAIFFAMILSDAGYGIVMAVLLAVLWKKLGKGNARFLCMLLTGSTIIWGMLVGSYFGVEPREHGLLEKMHMLDMGNMQSMMAISIVVGAVHIMLSNGVEVWRLRGRVKALAPVGWILTIASGLLAFLGGSIEMLGQLGLWGVGIGLGMVFLFSGAERDAKLVKRLGGGAMALTKITDMFGNVLSYLRLFALGIASAALAGAFNDLAIQAYEGVRGLGVVLALVILLIGHLLNFILAIMSGFIHGLRLNLIEFFNWSVREEGYAYRAFKKKSLNH